MKKVLNLMGIIVFIFGMAYLVVTVVGYQSMAEEFGMSLKDALLESGGLGTLLEVFAKYLFYMFVLMGISKCIPAKNKEIYDPKIPEPVNPSENIIPEKEEIVKIENSEKEMEENEKSSDESEENVKEEMQKAVDEWEEKKKNDEMKDKIDFDEVFYVEFAYKNEDDE